MTTGPQEEFSLRLFLSADLMGSTSLKSETIGAHAEPRWLSTFLSFYDEFPSTFKGAQQDLNCTEISFWKGVGDELLWVAPLDKSEHAISVLRAFKSALETYNKCLDQYDKKVRLKGSAWIAGFPITHKVVKLPEGKGDDYIGPYIDTGFRLSKFSTRMRMVISVDLAWLILKARAQQEDLDDLPLRFDESESMKGVLGGRPYPIIWIECESPLEQLEYKLCCRSNYDADRRKALRDYCTYFIADTDGKIITPYIVGDDVIGTPHESYQEWLDKQAKKDKEPLETTDEGNEDQRSDSQDSEKKPSSIRKDVAMPYPSSTEGYL